MNGKSRFSASKADAIRALLRKIRGAGRPEQKMLRRRLRTRCGFYISDFSTGGRGFSEDDFNARVRDGVIGIHAKASGRRDD